MRTNRDILAEAYIRLLKKAGVWAGLIAMAASMVMTGPANAAQVTARKVILSNPTPGASSVSYDINFTWTTNAASVRTLRFQFCSDSPIYNTTCTIPGGTFVRGTTITTQTKNGGSIGTSYTAATNGSSDVLLTAATANTFNTSDNIRIVLGGFTNVSTTNTEYYVRVVGCNDTSCVVGAGTNLDWGGFAVSTSQALAVSAAVQEDLTFCVGVTVTTPCTTVGSGTVGLTPNPMTTSGISSATAKMAASTNASAGYSITYAATSFTDTTSDTITAASTTGVAPGSGGTEQFGFTLAAQSSGALSGAGCAAPTGGSGTASSPYATNNQIAYNTAGGIAVASASAPTSFTTYTICYGANVAGTTKPGIYTATQTFLATGTF